MRSDLPELTSPECQESGATETVIVGGCQGWTILNKDEVPQFLSGVACVGGASLVIGLALAACLL